MASISTPLLLIFILLFSLVDPTVARHAALERGFNAPGSWNSTTSSGVQTIVVTQVIFETIFTTLPSYSQNCLVAPVQIKSSSKVTSTKTTSTTVSRTGLVSVGNVKTSIASAPCVIVYETCTTYAVEVYVYYTTYYTNGGFTSCLTTTTVTPGGPSSTAKIAPTTSPVAPYQSTPSMTRQPIGIYTNSSTSSVTSTAQTKSAQSSTGVQGSNVLLFTPIASPTNCPHLSTPTAGLTKIDSNETLTEQAGIQYSFYLDDNGNVAPEIGLLESNGDYVVFDLSDLTDLTWFYTDGRAVTLESSGTITFFSADCSIAVYTVLDATTPKSKRDLDVPHEIDALVRRDTIDFGLGVTIIDQCGSLQISLSPSVSCNGLVFGPNNIRILTYNGLVNQLAPDGSGNYNGLCGFPDINDYISKCKDQITNVLQGIVLSIFKRSQLQPRFFDAQAARLIEQELVEAEPALVPVAEEVGGPLAAALVAGSELVAAAAAIAAFVALEYYVYEYGAPYVAGYFCQECFQAVQMTVTVQEEDEVVPLLIASAAPSKALTTTLVVDQTTSSCSASTYSTSFSTSYSLSSSTSSTITSSTTSSTTSSMTSSTSSSTTSPSSTTPSSSSSSSFSSSSLSSFSRSSSAPSSSSTPRPTVRPSYARHLNSHTDHQSYGKSVFCCNGMCQDGTRLGDPGQCEYWVDLCNDVRGGPPSCSPTQVLAKGGDGNWVDSGDGRCYLSSCQWQTNNWTWSCYDCPPGYYGTLHGQCNGNDSDYDDCVSCGEGGVPMGNDQDGWYCQPATTQA